MPYITREDGEHFVIPSYRDVLAVKQKSALKKEILLLSQSYGEYITLQRKGANQYEVAFSPETGYLLGESIWHNFNRPLDFIYCEAIPNTTEAILVIVKAGSVYLDGSFPLEGIPEELVIFLTQQNNFEIFIYGDVPISQMPQEGKFSFEANSVKSFTVLDKPAFPTLPLVKTYQLQLVDQVLRAHGIGVFPIKSLIMLLAALGIGWMLYSYLSIPTVVVEAPQVNPYQGFIDALTTPSPNEEISKFLESVFLLTTIPGWEPTQISYSKGKVSIKVTSLGSKIENLYNWAKDHNLTITVEQSGIFLNRRLTLTNRPVPIKIYPLTNLVIQLVDNIATVYPGNHISLGQFKTSGPFTVAPITITVNSVTPMVILLIARQLEDLPFSLEKIDMSYSNGLLSGSLNLSALGS